LELLFALPNLQFINAMLEPHVLADHEAVSQSAADWLVQQLRGHPDLLLCLASGVTPERTYAILCERGRKAPSWFDRCRILKLDEWGGLPRTDRASCDYHLRSALIDPLELSDRYVAFDGPAADPQAECARIAQWLAENGPIDTCVLGLGRNGHLGFNEPADFLLPHAHVAELSEASLGHAMLSQSEARPTYGLTLGMADLMESRQILLVVTGAAKREPLQKLLSGQITTQFPASMLQMHPNVRLLCDSAAVEGRG
jgi:galactosamine-6-phosphate isomerase